MGRGGTHLPFRSPTISVWLPRSCGLLQVFKWLCTSETSGCLIYPVPHILSLYLMLRRWLLKSRWRWEVAPWVRTLAVQAWGTQSLSQRPHKKPGLAAQTYIPCTVLSWGVPGLLSAQTQHPPKHMPVHHIHVGQMHTHNNRWINVSAGNPHLEPCAWTASI